jgi:hypothetical protein
MLGSHGLAVFRATWVPHGCSSPPQVGPAHGRSPSLVGRRPTPPDEPRASARRYPGRSTRSSTSHAGTPASPKDSRARCLSHGNHAIEAKVIPERRGRHAAATTHRTWSARLAGRRGTVRPACLLCSITRGCRRCGRCSSSSRSEGRASSTRTAAGSSSRLADRPEDRSGRAGCGRGRPGSTARCRAAAR